jgi:flagellar hook-basal body complex protein FliE
MSINAIDNFLKSIPSKVTNDIKGINEPKGIEQPGQNKGEGSFTQALEKAMGEVNELQNEADRQIEGVTLKQDGVTPHGAMVALEKADIAFQLMSAIRGKIIRAYEEVIRTQV